MLELGDVAIADQDVGFAAHQRLDQFLDVSAGVLIVRVGIDDDVGTGLDAGVDAGLKGRRQAFVPTQPHHVVTPQALATSEVPSRDPSSMTRVSMVSMPGMLRGRSASVAGSVAASFRHGIWMISLLTACS